MDLADERHYRRQVIYILDTFCAGHWTIPMTLPALMCLLPAAKDERWQSYQAKLEVILQDLAESKEERAVYQERLVAFIVAERDSQEWVRVCLNAFEILKAEGVEVSVEPSTRAFYIDDEGPYTLAQLVVQARIRFGPGAAWRRRAATASNRHRRRSITQSDRRRTEV